jgi:hypothetical protein
LSFIGPNFSQTIPAEQSAGLFAFPLEEMTQNMRDTAKKSRQSSRRYLCRILKSFFQVMFH